MKYNNLKNKSLILTTFCENLENIKKNEWNSHSCIRIVVREAENRVNLAVQLLKYHVLLSQVGFHSKS